MDEKYIKITKEYDSLRERIITQRYHDPQNQQIMRQKWEQFNEIVYAITNHFSLLPDHAEFVNHISWGLAFYYIFFINQIGPSDPEGINKWARELFERLSSECGLNWLDLKKWQDKALELWNNCDPTIPSIEIGKQNRSEKRNLEIIALEKFLQKYNEESDI